MTVYNEEGVDLSLIRWTLSLSMEERLQALQDHANSLLMMRHEITITRTLSDEVTPRGGVRVSHLKAEPLGGTTTEAAHIPVVEVSQ